MVNQGSTRPTGALLAEHARDLGDLSARRQPPLSWRVRNFFAGRQPAQVGVKLLGSVFSVLTIQPRLYGAVFRPDWARLTAEQALKLRVLLQAKVDLSTAQVRQLLDDLGGTTSVQELARYFPGTLTEYGLLSTRLVTNNGVAFIVDAFQNLVELENMKYHGYGTGTTNEAQGDSALVTELTTEYATDSTRPTGTTTEGASANIYRTVATLSPDSGGTLAITEHGIFSANAAGVLLDRSKFSAVNLVAGADSLQTTYELTVSAGG